MTLPEKPTAPTARVSLRWLLDKYYTERDLSENYRRQLDWSLRRLRTWHGSPVHVDQLTDDFVNQFLLAEQARGASAEYLKNTRRTVLTMWRYAYERELLETLPRRVRKIKSEMRIPTAWTIEEVRRLIAAVDVHFHPNHVHRLVKCKTRLFWRAMIMTFWDTGLRRVDIDRIRRSDISPEGVLMIVQHKTGFPIRCMLQPETLAAIDATKPENREFVFDEGSLSNRARAFAKLVKTAGLTGTLKKLRKSSATAVEALRPGAASQHLGHKTPGLAARHYIDPRHTQDTKTRPPSLAQPTEQPKHSGDILAWL